jgi:biotin synthase
MQKFESLLQTAKEEITPKLALQILEESRHSDNALKLFALASQLRDQYHERRLWWTAAIEGILPCKLEPMCRYCSYSNQPRLSNDALLKAVAALEKLGFKHLHMSGGANRAGYDEEILSMVAAMRAVSDVAIEVNLGPSINRDTVRKLKQLGVACITSSLETFNEEVFQATKPGDSLAERKALLEMCEDEDVPSRGMLLIGLGESYADRIRALFYLKGLKKLHNLRFSRFMPPPHGKLDLPRCSPWEVARLVAVARLILPKVELCLAAGNSLDDIPLWWLAGGGNQLLGAHANRRKATGPNVVLAEEEFTVTSSVEQQRRYATALGLDIGFEYPKLG